MINVYFGPYCKSPASELPADERFLWFPEFHLLRGFDRDFWTANPLMLDYFDRAQIMLWYDDAWQPMPEVADQIRPEWRTDKSINQIGVGRMALGLCVAIQIALTERERANAIDKIRQ